LLTLCGRSAKDRNWDTDIDDDTLSLIAAAIYVAVPVILVWRSVVRPAFRPLAASMLGGIAPLSFIYLYVSIDFYVNQRTGEDAFAFYAMWIMGFGAYVVSLVVGLGLGFLNRPRNMIGRFTAAAAVVCMLFVGTEFAFD